MSYQLMPGERVRFAVRNRMAGYQPVDTGTVLRVAESSVNGERYYTVPMDKDGPEVSAAVFTEGEIEADA
jgi:hypothetical protein